MRMFFVFPGYCVFLCAMLLMLTMIAPGITTGVRAEKIGDHQSAFDFQPVTWDPRNPATAAYFVLDVHPNTHIHTRVLVTNTGTTRGTATLYPVDAFTAPGGGTAYHTHSDARTEVGSWIKLNSEKVTLSPHQSQIVSFDVNVPANASAGEHVGGIVAENMAMKPVWPKNLPIHVKEFRIIAVQVNIPGPSLEKLIATGIQPDGGTVYQRMQIGLRNTGNKMVKATGTLQILDANGHFIQKQELKYGTFLPQTAILSKINIQHKALPIGHYQAVMNLNYGHKQTLSYTTKFTIKPPKKTLASAITTLVKLGEADDLWSLFAPWQLALGAGIGLLLVGFLGYGLSRFCLNFMHQIAQRKEN